MNSNRNNANNKTRRLEAVFAAACGLGLLVWLTGVHETVGALISDFRSYGPDQCASIGDVCPDDSVYAGRTPDGNMFMFATPEDAPRRLPWSTLPAHSGMKTCEYYFDVGKRAKSCFTGEANTTILVTPSDVPSTHPAAGYCAALEAHGHGDWYLPAIEELGVLFRNSERVGGFKLSQEWSRPMKWDARIGTYWSSSERDQNAAVARDFAGLSQEEHVYAGKGESLLIRCVRTDPVPD
ncbi:MAG: DUF1566 domain-containing protein [Pseudorhodoplanes sp.]|nr:DUF1566 domain-containing protein [Pseudorhodoplanes sp.]